jgi:hypothetical protein
MAPPKVEPPLNTDSPARAPEAPVDAGGEDKGKSIAGDTIASTLKSDRIEPKEVTSPTETLSPGAGVRFNVLPFATPTDEAASPTETLSPGAGVRFNVLPFATPADAEGGGEPSRTQTRLDALPFMPESRLSSSPLSPTPPSPPIQADESPPNAPPRAEVAPLSVDVYAAIKAELWAEASPPDVVLARHGLDEVQWRVHERLHLEALASEARAGWSARALALMAALSAAQRGREKTASSEQPPRAPST